MGSRDGLRAQLAETIDKLQTIADDTTEEVQHLERTARREIRRHPTSAVAVALGVGFIVGALAGSVCRK
jgi:ElaB/YqjD/DUF883 family membrane-anchored ribosome-binding protein